LPRAVAGVDIGSQTAKSVVLLDGKVAGTSIIPTGIYSEKVGIEVLDKALRAANLPQTDLKYIIATGYGRISAPYANKTITEIACHAKGAHTLYPTTHTVLDMGGQDCKAIRVDDQGHVVDFAMNDKCAAGTGKFLDVLAKVFGISLDQLGPLSLAATQPCPISSTCIVFAESEVISLVARGEKPENIIGGIHHAIANRIFGLFGRTGFEEEIFFSGGVAKNVGMRKEIEKVFEKKIIEDDGGFDPQLVGAYGAAVIAQERATN
jgi:(R)-2-hydroxyacyl-CoA dehydratese activating ATPase